MIIDIHTHAFPDELAARAVSLLTEHAGVPAKVDGTCAGLVASMERAKIDRSVVVPIATKPSQVRSINSWSAEISRRYEGLIGFGTLHPDGEDWAAEIDRMVADGIPGIKMHPDYQLFFVDEPRMIPMYRALADAGMILLFHAGVDIGLPPPVHCTPDRLARVLDAVPELKVIAAHMGGYSCWDEVERYLVGRDLWFDTSYSQADLGRERMVSLMRAHGVERILFGTDSPWTDQSLEVRGMSELGLSEDELALVLGGNAGRLLGVW
jgi:uncharacterized protein